MNLKLDISHTAGYTSSSQIARVVTEQWVKQNIYCPSCGNDKLDRFNNNNPVADFLCVSCSSEYELKSQKKSFSLKIIDGAYRTMIARINAHNNPHFFFLNYSLDDLKVSNFLVIPRHYFVNDIIEKRKPLNLSARRAGWIGCNILLDQIPSTGKIYLVRNGELQNKKGVLEIWAKTVFLENQKQDVRGWLIEIMKLIEKIPTENFNLSEMYRFEKPLKEKFPNNNFIRDKIRQQLQVLRDKGILEFMGNGQYKKI